MHCRVRAPELLAVPPNRNRSSPPSSPRSRATPMLLRLEGGAPSPTGSMAIHCKPPHPHPPTPPTASPHLRPTQSPSHRPLPWVWDTTPGHAAAAKRRAKFESSGVSFQDFSPHSFLLCPCSGKRGRVTARNKKRGRGGLSTEVRTTGSQDYKRLGRSAW